MENPPTHSKIDETVHRIASIEDHPNDKDDHVRVHFGCGMTVDTTEGNLAGDSRWLFEGAADCLTCGDVEAGVREPVVLAAGHNRPITAPADVETGVLCPSCGKEIRKRKNGNFACVGEGHEYTAQGLIDAIQKNFSNLVQALDK